jgi:phage-related protein
MGYQMINKVRLVRQAEDFFSEKMRTTIDSIAKNMMEEQFSKAKTQDAEEVEAYAKALTEVMTANANAVIDLVTDYATELTKAMETEEP